MRILRWVGIFVLISVSVLALGLARAQLVPVDRLLSPPVPGGERIAGGGRIEGVVTTLSGVALAGATVSVIPVFELKIPPFPPGVVPVPLEGQRGQMGLGMPASLDGKMVSPTDLKGQKHRTSPPKEKNEQNGIAVPKGLDGKMDSSTGLRVPKFPPGSPPNPNQQDGRIGQKERTLPEKSDRTVVDPIPGKDRPNTSGMVRPFYEVRVDKKGKFRIDLPFGRYLVRITAPGFHPNFYKNVRSRLDAVEVELNREQPSLNFTVGLEPVSTLGGKVTVIKTGALVSEGEVIAVRLSPNRKFEGRGSLKSDGTYLIEGLDPGVYLLQVLSTGNLPELYTDAEGNSRIQVKAGDRIVGINIKVSEGASISGQVWDEKGQSVEGATLRAWPVLGLGSTQQTLTKPDGFYNLSGLTTGNYFVMVEKLGYGRLFYNNVDNKDAALSVKVSFDGQPTGIDFRLNPVGTVFGRVTERKGGGPINGARVLVETRLGKNQFRTITEIDGGFLVSNLPTADYLVQVQAKGYVSQFYSEDFKKEDGKLVRVLADKHTTGINMALYKLSSVSGVVSDKQGNKIQGADVFLVSKLEGGLPPPYLPPFGDALKLEPRLLYGKGKTEKKNNELAVNPRKESLSRLLNQKVYKAQSDENGGFNVEDVLPGKYLLNVKAKGYVDQFIMDSQEIIPKEIEISLGQLVTGVNLVLPKLGIISGRVTAKDGGQLEGLVVVARLVNSDRQDSRMPIPQDKDRLPFPNHDPDLKPSNPRKHVQTNDPELFSMGEIHAEILDMVKGHYRIGALPEGTYILRASARRYIPNWYSGAENVKEAELLKVSIDEMLPETNFELSSGGLISGTIMSDGSGRPISGASVTARQIRIGKVGTWRALTDQKGVFELNGLPEGHYFLHANAKGFVEEFYQDTPKPDRAIPIEIKGKIEISDLIFGLARQSPGDFDGDGDVDFSDLIFLIQKIMNEPMGVPEPLFDLNKDGKVEFQDLLTMFSFMRGSGKAAMGFGGVVWNALEGTSEEVQVGISTESIPISQGYFLKLTYDPEEALFVKAEENPKGMYSSGRFIVHEDKGSILLVGEVQGENRGGTDGLLARLRFSPIEGNTGITLKADLGFLFLIGGGFSPLQLPEPKRLEVPPKAFLLKQNFPNPFNPETVIAFELPEETNVELVLFNLLGQRIRTLLQEVKSAGRYKVKWDARDDLGRDVSSGIYFYHLKAGKNLATKRMLLLR